MAGKTTPSNQTSKPPTGAHKKTIDDYLRLRVLNNGNNGYDGYVEGSVDVEAKGRDLAGSDVGPLSTFPTSILRQQMYAYECAKYSDWGGQITTSNCGRD